MANYYPTGYQPLYYPQIQNPAQPQSQSPIIWVQGEAGAKSYMVAPNQTVQLWDSESQTIYLKSADASGMPSIRVLDYTIREKNEDTQIFATKNDLYALEKEIKSMLEKMREEKDG